MKQFYLITICLLTLFCSCNETLELQSSFSSFKKDEFGVIDESIAAEEAKIIDDFGAPKVSIGGSFSGTVKKVTDEKGKVKVEVVEDSEPEAVKIDFVLAMNEVNLDNTFSAALSINANSTKEILDSNTNTVLLTAEQVAEAKCKIFEKIIQDRAENKIKEYKAKLTDFETAFADEANFEEFEIPVI